MAPLSTTRATPLRSPVVEGCWLARFSDRPCDGRFDRAHLIAKQTIKRELRGQYDASELGKIVWHHTVWVHACRRHHGDFDNWAIGFRRVRREDLPMGLEMFAEEFGLVPTLDRLYGLRSEAHPPV